MQSKNKLLWLAPIFVMVIAVGWYFCRSYTSQIKLSPAEDAHVKELLNGMKTHCVGRYLIDLPASFILSTGTAPLEEEQWVANINWSGRSYKTYIASKRMYYPAFEQMLKRRKKELSEIHTINPANMPFLKKVWPLPVGLDGVIFERNLDISADDAVRTLEAYVYSEGVAIKIQKESINDSAFRYQKDRERRGIETNFIPEDIEKFNNLLSRIRGRKVDDIPRESGVCVANAFIATDKTGTEQEDITTLFSSENMPGFSIEVSTNNFIQEKESLLERTDEIVSALSEMNARIIRKGRLEINNTKAEEMLATGPKPDSLYPIYIFNLYINETRGSNATPWLNTSLSNESNRNIPDARYSQGELIEFWSTITRTVRMRLGAY